MSKYIDTFADATVETGSMTDTMTAPQVAVGTKKKVKIDASLLENFKVTSFLTSESINGAINDQNTGPDCSGRNCTPTQAPTDQCTQCCISAR